MEDSASLEANPACQQDNNTDLIQIKESSEAEVLHGQQDKTQWATREDLDTITEMLRKVNITLNHTRNIVAKVRKRTLSQQLFTLDCLQKQIENCWRQPVPATCDCRANKGSFYQNRRNVHRQRFNTRHTLNPSLTHSQYNQRYSSSQNYTRRYDGQKRQQGTNQPFPSQYKQTFPHMWNRPRRQRYNSRRRQDFRSQEFQTNGSNSLQDSFQSKIPNRRKKKKIEDGTTQTLLLKFMRSHSASRTVEEETKLWSQTFQASKELSSNLQPPAPFACVRALTTAGHSRNGSSTARLRSGPGISHDRTSSRSVVCIGLYTLPRIWFDVRQKEKVVTEQNGKKGRKNKQNLNLFCTDCRWVLVVLSHFLDWLSAEMSTAYNEHNLFFRAQRHASKPFLFIWKGVCHFVTLVNKRQRGAVPSIRRTMSATLRFFHTGTFLTSTKFFTNRNSRLLLA